MKSKRKIVQVAVIGWGNFFKHIHEQTLIDLVNGGKCALRGVCVRSPETRSAIVKERGAAYGTADYREVLADRDVDAVIIGAPHAIQASLSIESLEAGKYVYVEKPMFADEAETGTDPADYYRRLVAIGRPAFERLAVGLNKRFAPSYREIHDRAAEWKGIKSVSMSIVDDAWRWGSKYPPGFLMWLDACHWIDLARWFTGAEVDQLCCLSPQVEDSMVVMKMDNGSVASIFLSGNATMDRFKEQLDVTTGCHTTVSVTDYVQMEIFGGPRRDVRNYAANLQTYGDLQYVKAITEGGLEAFRAIRRDMYDRFLRLQAASSPDPAEDAYLKRNLPNFMRPQGWRESLTAFIETVAAGGVLSGNATYRDAYVGCQVVDACRKSVEEGGAFVRPSLPPPG